MIKPIGGTIKITTIWLDTQTKDKKENIVEIPFDHIHLSKHVDKIFKCKKLFGKSLSTPIVHTYIDASITLDDQVI